MQQFLVLFREPDGRKDPHTPGQLAAHRSNWNQWSEQMNKGHHLAGGMPLTLAGRVLRPQGPAQHPAHGASVSDGPYPHMPETVSVSDGPHQVGDEIIGGYLLINADSLEQAATLMQSCPIFEFGGYAEIREIMPMPAAPPSSSEPAPSPQEQNKSIVRRFNTSFIQEGDISAFHEIIDPSVINHTAPAGFSNGADGMFAVIDIFRKALTGLEVKILRQVAEDDIVVTHKRFHATHTGPLMGIPPSGKPVTITIIDIVRLRNGKYIEHWGIRDLQNIFLKTKK